MRGRRLEAARWRCVSFAPRQAITQGQWGFALKEFSASPALLLDPCVLAGRMKHNSTQPSTIRQPLTPTPLSLLGFENDVFSQAELDDYLYRTSLALDAKAEQTLN